MTQSDSYGEAFGKRLNAQATSFVTKRALPQSTIAVTELRYENPQYELSTPPAYEDAYLVAVHLQNFPNYQYWENGRAAPVSPIRPGETIVYDIKRTPIFHLNSAFHSVHFYFPRAALNVIADSAEASPIDELCYRPGVSRDDAVMRHLAQSLLPLFNNPNQASQLFMEHVLVAVGHHVAFQYGGMKLLDRPIGGGLAGWQEKRAKELLAANLAGEISLATLADACGLSVRHFTRAFRQSVGISPHRWLVQKRVELAKQLLQNSRLSLLEITLACGFADQSHFTRVFTTVVGIGPAAWRRYLKI
ncbi:helix-turn-helix transcriptional regulator [Rhizobium tropici]|uniref:Helix-turn-helix transcriptional regulator n=1 Tax=Rhizobium tropici TaxID=398 RepID=A0A5B0VQT0_RHITR|nr:AraC family transcriptional regulator [Rhizobium tropici]KAA1176525.1 helix-turn-helix transcriptional regulator [Rhizobium tropici]